MNKILYSLLLLFPAAAFLLPACKKDKVSQPVITDVRNYAAAPNDTVVHTVNTGQWVVVAGHNLSGVTRALFGGTPATINTTLMTDESIVIQIPSIPFQTVPRDKVNEITVVSEGGTATFNINITGAPIISHIRGGVASPADTIAKAIYPNQKINLIGYNLKNATSISFQGVPVDITNVVYTDTSVIVQVPADLSGGDATQANTISYTTAIGTGTIAIKIIGPPIITGVSNENTASGDSVYLYGNNFLSIQNLTFAGTTITSWKASDDATSIGFIVPALTQSGPVVIKTAAGTFTTVYNVNDVSTGVISNFEWGPLFKWDWWGGAELKSGDADFPGNPSQYLGLKTNVLNSGDGNDWSTGIRMSDAQWLPAENVSDPINNWVLKFEMSIPAPWNGGSLCIKSSNGDYMFRYEPWQRSSSTTEPYTTKGWQTVTIPLSSFRKNDGTLGDGKGAPITSILELVGSTGNSNLMLYMHNYGASPTATGFKAALDNFRVVKR